MCSCTYGLIALLKIKETKSYKEKKTYRVLLVEPVVDTDKTHSVVKPNLDVW